MNSEAMNICEYVTILIGGQRFGVPVLRVQDVLREQPLTHIPLAPAEVAGSLNLRGRVVTAIDLRTRLGLEKREEGASSMNVVVEQEGELYSLIVDAVGDVLSLTDETFEPALPTLDPLWQELTDGLHRLEDDLMLILDIQRVLGEAVAEAA